MNIRNIYRVFLFQGLWLFYYSPLPPAQNVLCDATTLEDFFNCYGGQSAFSTHSVAAVTTFIEADNALQAGNYAQAKTMLDNLFNTYPRGSNIWWNVFNDPNGANLGTPHAYYGLRMMEDIIDHGLNGVPNVPAKKAKMKIVLVGCSEGIQPTTEAELQNGTGPFVTHEMDPALKENDYRIVRQSFDLFSRYVTAITKGALAVELEFVELDALCLPVAVTTTLPHLAYSGIQPVWDAMTEEAKDSTDWWWILYPSHVPEFPTFDDEAFITGGMGADYKGGPVFIIDDKWVVRKPAHLGNGLYSDIERRIYLPQWLQHEFFHHLYRIYPELALEVNGHDWFDINFWASDFEGQFESDYYSETLHKRLQVNCTPLATKLITRVQDDLAAQYSTFSMDELTGPYSLDVIQNPWHEGNIIEENGEYFWKNNANVQWKVTPDFVEGRLETGNDCPYPGEDFFIELYRTVEGDYVPGAISLKFNTESYKKRSKLIRETAPIEIVLGDFERVPNLNLQHTGNILKTAGQFNWQNDAGDDWSLSPNTTDECFSLGIDSPTPGEKFQLVLVETECDIHALGFKYLGHYYWKPKRTASNGAPILVNGIADLELIENFGTHTINLADVFEDPEGDSLLLFVTSEDPAFISADITSQQLLLSGGAIGTTSIYVMALDANGGLAVDEFKVQVNPVSSTNEPASKINVYPRLTQDFIHVDGATADYNITLFSVDKSYQQSIPVSGTNMSIDLGQLPAGMYLLALANSNTGKIKVLKIIKY
ncbi:MAG: hypothetical protein IPH31_10750 [Lewinellaceae bacterium]|nr:hypothetical protein [Lewinellaceae bacterium]